MSTKGLLLKYGQLADGSNFHMFKGGLTMEGTLVSKKGVTETTGATGALTLTAAIMKTGLVRYLATGDVTLTTSTMTLLDASFRYLKSDSSFEFEIENYGTTGKVITLVGGTGITLVGRTTIHDFEKIKVLAVRNVGVGPSYTVTWKFYCTPIVAVKTGHVSMTTVVQADLADPDGVINDVDLTNASIAIGVQPDIPRNLIVECINGSTSATHLTAGGVVTIIGFDTNGNAITEVYTFAEIADGAVEVIVGVNIFATITSVTASNWVGLGGSSDEKINVGGGNAFGLPTSPGGQLIGVHKAQNALVNEAVGTVNVAKGSIVPTTLSSAGASSYAFWYTYV